MVIMSDYYSDEFYRCDCCGQVWGCTPCELCGGCTSCYGCTGCGECEPCREAEEEFGVCSGCCEEGAAPVPTADALIAAFSSRPGGDHND